MNIEQTNDGSYTLFVPELDEHYHSTKGALTESEHIFIRMGLEYWLASRQAETFPKANTPIPARNRKGNENSPVRILEIGFGTGLNAFLTLLATERLQCPVHYTTIELHPLSEELVRQLNYPAQIAPQQEESFYALHRAEWNKEIAVDSQCLQEGLPFFTLYKIEGDYTQYNFTDRYDVIYFDAFAPEKQPEMWSQPLFDRLYALLNPGGILTTYCAKGVVRRMLQTAGFTVERLPGPPGGKREILRGRLA